jgi:hypothetical protein
MAKKKPDPLDFNFGFNRKPRRRVKQTAAQRAAYQLYHGKGKKK